MRVPLSIWLIFSMTALGCSAPHAPPSAGVDRTISPQDVSQGAAAGETPVEKTWTPPDRHLMEDIPPEYRAAVRQYFGDALERTPVLDWFDHGMEAYQAGDYPEAARSLEKVLEAMPNFHAVRYNLALVYLKQKRYARAIEALEYVIREADTQGVDDLSLRFNPTLVHDARINLGMAYLESGQPKKAIPVFMKMMPDETAHYDLIVAFDQLHEDDRVIALVQEYTDAYGDDATLLNLMGLALYRKGQFERALQAFQRASKADTNFVDAWVNLGHLYMRLDQFEEAEKAFQTAKKIDPEVHVEAYLQSLQSLDVREARIHTNNGVRFWNQGQVDAAVAEWQRAIELDPSLTQAHLNLAMAYRKQHRYREAIEALKQVARLDPSSFEAHYQLGILHAQMKQYADAAEAFQRAAAIKPEDPEVQYNLGLSLYRSAHREEALAPLRKAIEKKPTWAEPRLSLALILGELKRYDAAIEALRDLLKLHPRNSDAYYNLGVLYMKQERREEAVQALERAVQIDPLNTRARALLDQLTGSTSSAP